MEIVTYIPSEELSPYIRDYKIIESRQGTTNKVLPNTSATLAFCFSGNISYLHGATLDFATFSGIQKTTRLIQYEAGTAAIIVTFREISLPAFFKMPVFELCGKSVSLDQLFAPSALCILREQMLESASNTGRIAILERFLLATLHEQSADEMVVAAIDKINRTKGNIRIKELIKEMYISQDAFEKRFRKATGASPKQFAHIVKMKSAISLYTAVPSLLDLAFEHGYYDQPHFNRDFKRFTGQTPTDFFRASSYW
ncbi:helix-turn-helix domain-containing protein [Chitinophaga horti]|uniref:Helix-turn-helix domain-containing protein n=1 Tax=Chitinophaga horti TaxID=2920382 RepID=A0ABY6J3T4_9BACT|nr:helix-turn-helix domain-containing protein [Chitinophaga horti]UYQ94328.1 helix-turn-helix domain-containing protein [Chitinophaga horti]